MTASSSEPRYQVLWPLGKIDVKAQNASAPIADLSGKTVCELWDYIFRGDVVYTMLREELRARYPGIKFVEYSEIGNTHGPAQREILANLPEKLRSLGVDAVISGIGA